jgi:hypothetical protein
MQPKRGEKAREIVLTMTDLFRSLFITGRVFDIGSPAARSARRPSAARFSPVTDAAVLNSQHAIDIPEGDDVAATTAVQASATARDNRGKINGRSASRAAE